MTKIITSESFTIEVGVPGSIVSSFVASLLIVGSLFYVRYIGSFIPLLRAETHMDD